LKHFITIYY